MCSAVDMSLPVELTATNIFIADVAASRYVVLEKAKLGANIVDMIRNTALYDKKNLG